MQSHIELFLGPMFAGKSTGLINRATELTSEGLRVAMIKHSRDTRWNTAGLIKTHGNHQAKATMTASTMKEVVDYVFANNYQAVAVDEGQFYPDIVEWADYLANNGITVLVAALDSNFLNHPTSR